MSELKFSTEQRILILYMHKVGTHGVTWFEVADFLEVHHGSASGILSRMHRQGAILRLKEKRNNSRIYVLPDYLEGREFEEYVPRRKEVECPECAHTFTV